MKPLYLALVVTGLGFAQQIDPLNWLVSSTPAYVGSDGSLYAISEVGCSKFFVAAVGWFTDSLAKAVMPD